MKRLFLMLLVAIVAATSVQAQQISVVATDGSTDLYNTLQEAIEGADPGSVIYLPGGGFPLSSEVKITKKLTIIGIGHKVKNDNPDSNSTITGSLYFDQGSDGSALMGCYVTGRVYIGNDGNQVDDVLIRYNFLNDGVEVRNNKCLGTSINQNYCKGATFNGASGTVSNNIITWIYNLDNGYILNNITTSYNTSTGTYCPFPTCDQTTITNNIVLATYNTSGPHSGSNCIILGNMSKKDWGDEFINVGTVDWNTVFVKNNGVNTTSDYHFTQEYSQYEGKVGVYADGANFDKQLAPVPYIVAKRVDSETDSSGKLNVKIRVKAGQ